MEQLGPYRILDKVGEGGMGEVYRARDTRLDRTVAIKIIRTDFSERFEREAKSISALNHPNICTLHDVGRTSDYAYLVMEFVDGAPLAGPLPIDDVLKLGMQICDALHAAHSKDIVHRDLKPANILVSKGSIKLLDFGLAKPKAASSSQSAEQATMAALTGAHTVVGTPQYMAPEQIEGREADARTDIFALGCVLYELVTGKRAFDGKTSSNVMAAILATEPRKPSELAPVTPPELEWVILRCLEKDPQARWQSAHDLRLQLQWIAGHGEPAGAATRPAATRPLLLGAVGGLVLAGAAAGLYFWLGPSRGPANAANPTGPIAFAIPMPDKVPSLWDSTQNSAIAFSPDGRAIAFVGDIDGGPPAIFLRYLDRPEVTKLEGTEYGSGPFFSPDGKWIGFTSFPTLKRIPVTGGVPLDVCFVPADVRGAAFLDNDTIVFSATTGGLLKVPAQGGNPTPLTNLDPAKKEKTHRSLVALPDGKAVVFIIGSNEIDTYDEARIVAMTLATGQMKELATGYAPVFSPSGHLLFVREGNVMAVPFDSETLAVGTSPVQVLKDVAVLPDFGVASMAVSSTGVLAYATGGDRREKGELKWIDREGTIQSIPDASRSYWGASVSPNGRQIGTLVSGANNSVWVFDRDRLQPHRVTFRFDVDSPVWQGNERITYWSGADVRSIRADGSQKDEVLISAADLAGRIARPVVWSADGQTLVLMIIPPDRGPDIYRYSTSDRKLTPILETRFNEGPLDLSPDGRWLLYRSDESGRPQTYVYDLMESVRRESVSSHDVESAQFARQGREVIYHLRNEQYAVSFTPGAKPAFGKPEKLFGKAKPADFELSLPPFANADGTGFVFVKRKRLQPIDAINVVTDWAAQLSKLVR